MVSTQTISSFNQMLSDVGACWGISFLKLDEQGCCFLKKEEIDIRLELSSDGSAIYFDALLGAIPDEAIKHELFHYLLSQNARDEKLRGCHFCIDESINKILLKFQADVDTLDSISLEAVLGNFITIAYEQFLNIIDVNHALTSGNDIDTHTGSTTDLDDVDIHSIIRG